jgi:hypothetical protein
VKYIFFFFAAFLMGQLVKAQIPDYYVYLTHGDVWIQQPGNKSVKIKPKQLVYAPDVIEIKDQQAEIELVNREDNFIVLNAKGSYKVSALKEKLSKKTEGLTKKYLRLVWEAISHTSSDFAVYKNESVAASWGAGARGVDCGIQKFPPNNPCFFSDDSLFFKWENKDIHKTYHFDLYDSSQTMIIELLVRDTQLVLLTRSLSLGEYYWSIEPVTHPCRNTGKSKITLVSKQWEDSVTVSLIKTIPLNKDDILYNLQISELLGNRGFISKALKYFNKSWDLYMRDDGNRKAP